MLYVKASASDWRGAVICEKLGSLSTRTGDHDGNVNETIKLIAETKGAREYVKLAWSRGRRASRATSIASFTGFCQDVSIIFRNYHSRSSVVRDDEAINTLAEREEIWAKIRICRVAKASEIRKQSFPGSSRCRRRPGLLKLPIGEGGSTRRIVP